MIEVAVARLIAVKDLNRFIWYPSGSNVTLENPFCGNDIDDSPGSVRSDGTRLVCRYGEFKW